jgi:hypothetical protein
VEKAEPVKTIVCDAIELKAEDCPECGTPLSGGRCPSPAKHNGGVK